MSCRADAGGTLFPKSEVTLEISPITSTYESLLISGGQASVPQWAFGFVPAELSTVELKLSQSGSFAGTGQGGRFWAGFGHAGQLSVPSGTPSPSASAGVAEGVGVAPGHSTFVQSCGTQVTPSPWNQSPNALEGNETSTEFVPLK